MMMGLDKKALSDRLGLGGISHNMFGISKDGPVSVQFYDLFKTFIPLIQPSLYSNSRTHDFTIYKLHDTRTSRQ